MIRKRLDKWSDTNKTTKALSVREVEREERNEQFAFQ